MNPNETRTYRGRTLEELLPQIRADLGPTAVITRRREGVHGGVGGFFGKRMVEVEACAGGPVPALPGGSVIDAYDTGSVSLEDDESPVIRRFIEQSSPFAQELDAAADRLDQAGAELRTAEPAQRVADAELDAHDVIDDDDEPEGFQPDPLVTDVWPSGNGEARHLPVPAAASTPVPAPVSPPAPPAADAESAPSRLPARIESPAAPEEWVRACEMLVDLGMPAEVVQALATDAERTMIPFLKKATPEDLLRKVIARHLRVEHGWRTKRRVIALVGPAGSGKTTTAAKLCHAYAEGSSLPVRALTLEPAASAYRLGGMIEHLNVELGIAETPEVAARAAKRARGDGLIVVDTPAVSQGDLDGIAELARLLEAVRPDETHLVVPACFDARATTALYEALSAEITVNRILISRIDEVPSAAVAVGSSFTLKRPISYITDGRDPSDGLRPAEPAEIAELVLP